VLEKIQQQFKRFKKFDTQKTKFKSKRAAMLELQNISFRTPESDAGAQSPADRTIIHDLSFTF
jgi:hypothetical protein